jgi:hypothetical protein
MSNEGMMCEEVPRERFSLMRIIRDRPPFTACEVFDWDERKRNPRKKGRRIYTHPLAACVVQA